MNCFSIRSATKPQSPEVQKGIKKIENKKSEIKNARLDSTLSGKRRVKGGEEGEKVKSIAKKKKVWQKGKKYCKKEKNDGRWQ